MRFAFVAKHRGIWPVAWACKVLDVSTSGFHDWLHRKPVKRTLENESLLGIIQQSFHDSDRTYGARRVWRDVMAEGLSCGLHRSERLMHKNALKARPRRRKLPSDTGLRVVHAIAPNILDRQFHAVAPNRKWIADFTYVWTAKGRLYVAAVINLFSRRVVGWSMSATITALLGPHWFWSAGGMPPTHLTHWAKPQSGQNLWFSEREDIALELARGTGSSSVARHNAMILF